MERSVIYRERTYHIIHTLRAQDYIYIYIYVLYRSVCMYVCIVLYVIYTSGSSGSGGKGEGEGGGGAFNTPALSQRVSHRVGWVVLCDMTVSRYI